MQASKKFYNNCSENSRSQIVFRTDIFRKLTLDAPVLFPMFIRGLGDPGKESECFKSRTYDLLITSSDAVPSERKLRVQLLFCYTAGTGFVEMVHFCN